MRNVQQKKKKKKKKGKTPTLADLPAGGEKERENTRRSARWD